MAANQRIEVLRVNTFGVDPRARYALPDRRHKGGPVIEERTALQLFNSLRGTTIAAYLAARERDLQDLAISLTINQRIGAEMIRRLLPDLRIAVHDDEEGNAELVAAQQLAGRL